MKSISGLALLALVVTALAFPQRAEAHSRPVRFDPAPGAVLEAAPAVIRGWFSSDLRRDPEKSFLRVLDATRNRVDAGETQLSADRRVMSVPLRQGLGAGAYIVHWSTFDDADGEVFSGCYAFYVGQPAADVAVAESRPLDGGSACPANPPVNTSTLDIEVKTSGRDATLLLKPANFSVRVPDGGPPKADTGHFHIYLDALPLDALTGHSHDDVGPASDAHGHGSAAAAEPGNPFHWYDTTYNFSGLSPGWHTVVVALYHDHTTPFSPPVVAQARFEVAGGARVPLVVAGLVAVVALGGGVAAGRLASRRART